MIHYWIREGPPLWGAFPFCGCDVDNSKDKERTLWMFSRHGILSSDTVEPVALDADYREVEIINVDGASAIYFTVDGSDPAVSGDNTYVLPATICSQMVTSRSSGITEVKLISNGTPAFAVVVDG